MKKLFNCLAAAFTLFAAIFVVSCSELEIAQDNVWVEKDISYTVSDIDYTISVYSMYNDGSYSTSTNLQDNITLGEGWNIFMVFTTSNTTVNSTLANKWIFKNVSGTVDWSELMNNSTAEDGLNDEDESKMDKINFGADLWELFYLGNYRTFEASATSNVPSEMQSKNSATYTEITDFSNISIKKILANLLLSYLS